MLHGLRRFCSAPHHSLAADDLDLLLRRCTTAHQAKQIHAQLLHRYNPAPSFLIARLVSLYSWLRLLPDAIFLFSVSPHTSSLLFNSILRATLSHRLPQKTLLFYMQMLFASTAVPDCFTFPLVIRAATLVGDKNQCRSVHGHAIVAGFESHLHVSNELVAMYANMGRMDFARHLFDKMPLRNILSWNVLINGFSANFDCQGAFDAFCRMESVGMNPNAVTWASLLSAHARCQQHDEVLRLFGEMRAHGREAALAESVAVALSVCAYINGGLAAGKRIHTFVVKNGFEAESSVRNSLVCMYGKLGNREDAEVLFAETETKDVVSWNALISSYAAAGLCVEAYELLIRMEVTPNLVSWSAVIGSFASQGMAERVLEVFRKMLGARMKPNPVIVATVLSACAELSALCNGREVHAHIVRAAMDGNLFVLNGLLHMYNRSGSLQEGLLVFGQIQDKDLVSWNLMIAGYGLHGFCDEALDALNDMVRHGFQPDSITFIAILSACSHSGYVSEGRQLFNKMINKQKIPPKMVHYGCMVDLLGRAGLLQEVTELIQTMPMKPNACVLGALLHSCRIHGSMTVAVDTATRVLGSEVEGTGNYMLLSNLYSACGQWEAAAKVRVITKAKGLKKSLGQSWIEVQKKVHIFSAGSASPSCSDEVYVVLEALGLQMEDKFVQECCLLLQLDGCI